MLSKESIRKASKEQKVWLMDNPNASLLDKIARSFQTSARMHEMDLRWGTLPSIICPTPEPLADEIDYQVEKLRHRIKRMRNK